MVEVVIEVARLDVVKRGADGRVAFVSPVPCPFAYGSVVGTSAEDGDPLDALVIGARPPRGAIVRVAVVGRVHFVDGGLVDDKLVCCHRAPTLRERVGVRAFFEVYARVKAVWGRLRGERGATRCTGITWVVVA